MTANPNSISGPTLHQGVGPLARPIDGAQLANPTHPIRNRTEPNSPQDGSQPNQAGTRSGIQLTRSTGSTSTTDSHETSRTSSTTETSETAEGSTTSTTQKEAAEETEATYREHRADQHDTRKQNQNRQQNRAHTYAWRVANRCGRPAGAARSDRTGVGR